MKTEKLPTGALTFLFTDIEGSTLRWERDRAAMTRAVQRHDAVMREAIRASDGHIFKTIGDAFCAAFPRPESAVIAALKAQRRLTREDFSAVDGLRVRMALHSGIADERGGDYFGPALNRVARIISIVHGGQVVISDFTSGLVRNNMPPDASLVDLGRHRLKDLAEPERLYQLVAADLPREFPMLRSLELLPNNLPLQLTRFIGRDDELAATSALLAESRLVTLVGAGGIGKTRLALQLGADSLDHCPEGVWFVELAPARDAEQVVSAVAQIMGVKESSKRSITESLVGALRRKKLLLILDNCEHVVGAAATLSATILRECREVQILATSRQPLGLSGERAHRVSSLTFPSERTVLSKEDAPRYGALALFADRARLAVESFGLTDDNVGIVAQICRRLDGIALAIELAAPRLKMLTLQQLASRLSERFRVLTGGSRDALPRQQTMRALIDWSYDLLDEGERRLFRRLCVFAGSFSLEAAAAVSAYSALDDWQVFDVLASLVDKSLVVSEPADSQQRYRLLESLREYAVEKAGENDEVAALRQRHAEYHAKLAERARAAYASSTSRMAWARELETNLEEFRAALDWTLGERADAELGGRLLTDLSVFWNIRGMMIAACRWADLALAEDISPGLQAALWLTLGWARDHLMSPKPALDAFARAHELYEDLDDSAGLAGALRGEGFSQVLLGDVAPGNAAMQHALTIYRELDDRRQIAITLSSIALGLKFESRLTDARAAQLEVLELYRALGDEPNMHITILRLAETDFELGELASAIVRAQENLKQDVVRADASLFANQQSNLAGYLIAANRFEEAQAYALDALRAARNIQNHVFVAFALQHLAALSGQSNAELAARLLGYAGSVFATGGLAREYTEQCSYDRAMTMLRRTLSRHEIDALAREGAALTEDQAVELAQATPANQAGGKV